MQHYPAMSTGTMKLGIWEATLTGASSTTPDDPALMALAGKMKTSTLEEIKIPRRLVEDRYPVTMLVAFVNTLETEAPEPGKPYDNYRRFEATNIFPRCHRGNGKIGYLNCITYQRTQTYQHYVLTP
jgi:hypothetical protein